METENNGLNRLISVPQAESQTGIRRWNLYRLVKEGELEAIKVGSRLYLDETKLKTYLTKCKTTDENTRMA